MIILGSGSPRRRELLEQIGASFRVAVSSAPELKGDDLAPAELTQRNALAKAEAVAAQPENAGQWVLGADTLYRPEVLDRHVTYAEQSDVLIKAEHFISYRQYIFLLIAGVQQYREQLVRLERTGPAPHEPLAWQLLIRHIAQHHLSHSSAPTSRASSAVLASGSPTTLE